MRRITNPPTVAPTAVRNVPQVMSMRVMCVAQTLRVAWLVRS